MNSVGEGHEIRESAGKRWSREGSINFATWPLAALVGTIVLYNNQARLTARFAATVDTTHTTGNAIAFTSDSP